MSNTNLVSINFINITVKTQKTGQMTVPKKVRDFMGWQDGDLIAIDTKGGGHFVHQLVSGGELYTYNNLPGDTTIQMTLSKVSSYED
jgi:AbrB family looped-hinge helix DNA binding protein